VLFLLRPRQTYLPYALPRDPKQMAERNQLHQAAYDSTRRLPPPEPSAAPDLVAQLKDLAALHDAGKLSDDEFAAMKARLLDG
jgi:hypothetical protein